MEFFGITLHGPQNFIADAMKEGYKEPMTKEEVEPVMKRVLETSTCPKSITRPDVNVIRIIDCYLGRTNGFAYGSFQRFLKMKRKAVMKPVGPHDMYRIPPTRSFEYGWHLCDPALHGQQWCRLLKAEEHPLIFAPNTHILDIARLKSKGATLY